MIKIALIGYGKMGRIIESLSNNYNMEVVSIIDPTSEDAKYNEISEKSLNGCDVCIDFSSPLVAKDNIKKVLSLKKPLVVGTTGWYEDLEEIKTVVNKENTGLIYSTNFSVGVNMMFKIIDYSTQLFNKIDGYDVAGFESHHNMKQDIPSGTAKTISNIVLSKYDKKKEVVYQPGNRAIKKEELHFTSLRCGSINGMHQVIFDSLEDQIMIQHNANNREGFAKGALLAAKYILNKKGVYNFTEVFDDILEGGNYGN
jgi:4-hydroxy-tetrahydrodipicolinate reductase